MQVVWALSFLALSTWSSVKGAYIRNAYDDVNSLYPTAPVLLHVLPNSYLSNSRSVSLFDQTPFPLSLRLRRADANTLDLDLDAVNKYSFRCAYEPSNGQVQWVRAARTPSVFTGTSDQVVVEKKVVNIINKLKTISHGGSHIQFLGSDGAGISFGLPTNVLPWCNCADTDLTFDPSSYYVEQRPVTLFAPNDGFSITLHARYVQEGVMDLEVRALEKIYGYRVTYDSLLGTVTRVARVTNDYDFVGTAEQILVQKKITTLVEHLKVIRYGSQLVTLVGDNEQAAFRYSSGTVASGRALSVGGSVFPEDELQLLPYTYTVDQKPSILFQDTTFPFTLKGRVVHDGLAELDCRGLNKYRYQVYYAADSGRVARVNRIYAPSQLVGTSSQLTLENKILSVIDHLHTFEYGNDNVRLISSPESTLAFGIPTNNLPFCGSTRCEYGVDPSTYYVGSTSASLFQGATFPMTVRAEYVQEGILDLYFKAVNTYTYRVTYNPVERTVLNVARIGGGVFVSSPQEQIVVERKVVQIIEKLQSFQYDRSTITFRSDAGSLGWTLPDVGVVTAPGVVSPMGVISSAAYGGEIRRVVPSTYFFRGSFQPLFSSGLEEPITVVLTHEGLGVVDVVVRALNTMRFRIQYNNADGWVSNVVVGDRTSITGDASIIEAEAKIRNIIANVQQVAFERDGRIQFITDNGSTRISCDLSNLV